jgi:hypothetical protein
MKRRHARPFVDPNEDAFVDANVPGADSTQGLQNESSVPIEETISNTNSEKYRTLQLADEYRPLPQGRGVMVLQAMVQTEQKGPDIGWPGAI